MSNSIKILEGWRPVYITAALIVLVSAFLSVIGSKAATAMIKDDGLVQIITAVVLCTGVALALLRVIGKVEPVLTWAEATWLLMMYSMREMDFHRLFTAEHVTRVKLYTGPFPLEQKLIGGTIVLISIAVIFHFLKTNLPVYLKSLRDKAPRARWILVWFILLGGAQIIDKPRVLRGALKKYAEESMELGAAILMLLILLSFSPDLKSILRRGRPVNKS